MTGKPSTADNAISIAAYKMRRKVDPVSGKSSSADDAISYSAYKKRVSKNRERNNKHADQRVKRSMFSFKVNKVISNEVMDPANSIKTEVNDYKLGF